MSSRTNGNTGAVQPLVTDPTTDGHVKKPVVAPPPTPISKLKGFIFVLTLFLTAYLGTLYLLLPAAIVMPFSLSFYRAWTDFFSAVWFRITIVFTEWVFGTKFVVTGDDTLANPQDSAIVISNHRTRLDWFYLWSFFLRRGRLENEKIILKDSLKKIPGFGWAMQFFCFLFLSRNWERDEAHITSLLRRFADVHYPVQLLLFPEGTDLTLNTKARSDKWAKELGLPSYEYCLHPRVKGFEHCIKLLRGTVNAIYDVTIGYPDLVPQNEKYLLQGILPREIHYHVARYPLSELPADDHELGKWVERKWVEKEQNLKRFYQEGNFQFLNTGKTPAPNRDTFLPLACTAMFWAFYLCFIFWALWNYWWVRWFFVFGNLFFVFIAGMVFDGWERVEIKMATAKSQQKNK